MSSNCRMEPNTEELLRKYIAGGCTAAELQRVRHLIAGGVSKETWLQILDDQPTSDEADLDSAYLERVYASIINEVSTPSTKTARQFQSAYRIAASLALLIACAAVFYFLLPPQEVIMLSEATLAGEQKKVVTPDGSVIWLNHFSALHYPERFEGKKRNVSLEGEAFFEIQRDTLAPFTIGTGEIQIRVLGTSFNVTSYSADDFVFVTVATGKIEVTNQTGSTMLMAGDQLVYEKKTKKIRTQSANPADAYAWREGWLVFNSQPLAKVARILERTYDIQIAIPDEKLARQEVTLKLKKQRLTHVLEIMAHSGGFSFEQNDKVVTIKPLEK